MDFPGKKINGVFVTPAPIAEQARKYWERIPDGTSVVKSITVPRGSKTENQLGAIFGLMLTQAEIILDDRGYDTSFLYNLPDPTGNAITKDALKIFFYNVCPIFNEDGVRITLSKANTKEAAKFFDDVRNYLATQWQIVVPEPDPNYKTNGQ